MPARIVKNSMQHQGPELFLLFICFLFAVKLEELGICISTVPVRITD